MESLEAVGSSLVLSMEKAGHQQDSYKGKARACMASQYLILVLWEPRPMLLT